MNKESRRYPPARTRRFSPLSWLARFGWALYLSGALLWMELALKLWCFRSIGGKAFVFTLLLTAAAGALFTFLASLGGRRFFRTALLVLLGGAFLLFGAQAVYYRILKGFLLIRYLTQAGMAIGDFYREALLGLGQSAPILLIFAVPLVLWAVFGGRVTPPAFPPKSRRRLGGSFCLIALAASLLISTSNSGIMSVDYLYHDAFVPELSMRYFGALTTLRQDLRQALFGEADSSPSATPAPTESPAPTDPAETAAEAAPTAEPVDRSANVLEIDFDALLAEAPNDSVASLHRFFSEAEPSYKNEYTGLFEGYNLLWICAEGFSSFAMDETHLPTLWRLAHEGFVFTNFYNPYWYFSTADGEFTLQNSLIPSAGDKSVYTAMYNLMPFGMGNVLNPLGYSSYAFHNHTSLYYARNRSMPNLGYAFYANDTGLSIGNTWPESDVDLIDSSLPYYLDSEPFNVYMMTMSGHLSYNFYGNEMSIRHESETADLADVYSDGARAYIACQMEFDQALEKLLGYLEEAGVLDRTLIVVSGDHYPYDLDPQYTAGASGLAELGGEAALDALDKYKSTLIVWNAAFAAENTVEVDTLCCQMDVLPTLLNLLGVDFDSRFLLGRDIFSRGTERLVVFRDQSFLSDCGRYDAAADRFTAADGVFADETEANAYAAAKLSEVSELFSVSSEVLRQDYYASVFEP